MNEYRIRAYHLSPKQAEALGDIREGKLIELPGLPTDARFYDNLWRPLVDRLGCVVFVCSEEFEPVSPYGVLPIRTDLWQADSADNT